MLAAVAVEQLEVLVALLVQVVSVVEQMVLLQVAHHQMQLQTQAAAVEVVVQTPEEMVQQAGVGLSSFVTQHSID